MAEQKLLTRPEAAAYCRVALGTFDAHVRGALHEVRIGRRVLFRREDLDAWLATPRAGARADTPAWKVTRDQLGPMAAASLSTADVRVPRVALGPVGIAIRDKLVGHRGN